MTDVLLRHRHLGHCGTPRSPARRDPAAGRDRAVLPIHHLHLLRRAVLQRGQTGVRGSCGTRSRAAALLRSPCSRSTETRRCTTAAYGLPSTRQRNRPRSPISVSPQSPISRSLILVTGNPRRFEGIDGLEIQTGWIRGRGVRDRRYSKSPSRRTPKPGSLQPPETSRSPSHRSSRGACPRSGMLSARSSPSDRSS